MANHPPSARRWLLSVVSAAALFPACAVEPDPAGEGPPDDGAKQDASYPIGVVVNLDAGSPRDASYPLDASYPGVIPRPYDAGIVEQPDAGHDASCDVDVFVLGIVARPVLPPECYVPPPDAGCSRDASVLNGIVIQPPDADCQSIYPGVVVRNDNE